ncbi:hypothetical protein KCH_70510 [Kitasatospora cheerisanensis KCTC 2395]|uniref:Uncharacterized protein n=1 Tax=Kitasatospora cheerisanensis KCTC 2395 TaxID=1348663 RepID=A0A066YTL2_9ACTN|nr:hypothetical protein KCH_70510 [Kitasatospora cheerisanensis KCTC 2395]
MGHPARPARRGPRAGRRPRRRLAHPARREARMTTDTETGPDLLHPAGEPDLTDRPVTAARLVVLLVVVLTLLGGALGYVLHARQHGGRHRAVAADAGFTLDPPGLYYRDAASGRIARAAGPAARRRPSAGRPANASTPRATGRSACAPCPAPRHARPHPGRRLRPAVPPAPGADPARRPEPGPGLAVRPGAVLDGVRGRRLVRRQRLLHPHLDPRPAHRLPDQVDRGHPAHRRRRPLPRPRRQLLGRHLRRRRQPLLRHRLHRRPHPPGRGRPQVLVRAHPEGERRMPVALPRRHPDRLQETRLRRPRRPVAALRPRPGRPVRAPRRREPQPRRPGRLAGRADPRLRPARRGRPRHRPVVRPRRRHRRAATAGRRRLLPRGGGRPLTARRAAGAGAVRRCPYDDRHGERGPGRPTRRRPFRVAEQTRRRRHGPGVAGPGHDAGARGRTQGGPAAGPGDARRRPGRGVRAARARSARGPGPRPAPAPARGDHPPHRRHP